MNFLKIHKKFETSNIKTSQYLNFLDSRFKKIQTFPVKMFQESFYDLKRADSRFRKDFSSAFPFFAPLLKSESLKA